MRARPSTSLSTTNTRCAMNLPPPARTPVAGVRQLSCTHRARPETGLTPRLDWLPVPTAFHKLAVCVQSLPDFDREGRHTERLRAGSVGRKSPEGEHRGRDAENDAARDVDRHQEPPFLKSPPFRNPSAAPPLLTRSD